jgi:DNA-binding Lrp family transcriptional regulator
MPNAYVMVTSVPGTEKKIRDEVTTIPGVVSVDLILGVFDLIIKVQASTGSAMSKAVSSVRRVPSIRSTFTMSSIEGEYWQQKGAGIDYLAPSTET